MRLTGKAKDLFEAWWHINDDDNNISINTNHTDQADLYDLHHGFQWGIYQDWADSIGYELYISKESPVEYFWAVCDLIRSFYEGECKTRQEARNAAIDKLNEIVNGQELTIKDQ